MSVVVVASKRPSHNGSLGFVTWGCPMGNEAVGNMWEPARVDVLGVDPITVWSLVERVSTWMT